MLPAARAAYTPYKTGLRPQWSLAAGQSNRPAALAALPTATHKGAHCSGRPRSAAMVRISGLNSSMLMDLCMRNITGDECPDVDALAADIMQTGHENIGKFVLEVPAQPQEDEDGI